MPAKIKADVLEALDDWKAGKPVKSIELGHVHRMKETSHGPRVDLSVRLSNDQERAHAFCFAVIEHFDAGAPEHAEFLEFCRDLAGQWNDLTPEEAEAAEGLAWKALLVGWRRAIDGHGDAHYIEVSRPQVQAT
jgi:hypothetical protein